MKILELGKFTHLIDGTQQRIYNNFEQVDDLDLVDDCNHSTLAISIHLNVKFRTHSALFKLGIWYNFEDFENTGWIT